MLFLNIMYVFRLVQQVLYSAESGCNTLSCLYNLSLYLIDVNIPFIIQLNFLYLYLWNLTTLVGMCLFLVVSII